MTPQEIRALADRQDRVSPDAALFVAPVLRALAELYEANKKHHIHDSWLSGCLVCDALKRLEELQP